MRWARLAMQRPRDITIAIPSDWDLFWDNIRSDFFDVIVVDPFKQPPQLFPAAGANYTDRVLTLRLMVTTQKAKALCRFVYYQNPTQSSDLAVATTIASALSGHIDYHVRAYGITTFAQDQQPCRKPLCKGFHR